MAQKMVLTKVTLLVLAAMVAMCALRVDAELDPSSILGFTGLETDKFATGEATACCDSCICTRSIPPQCRCTDIKAYCHTSCQSCLCTRSIPPQCRCTDITSFCYKPCTVENGLNIPST